MSEKIRCSRQQRGNRVLSRHGLKISVGEAIKMIVGGRIEACQARKILRRELANVSPYSQACLLSCGKNPLRLCHIERASLAKDIHIFSQALLNGGGDHLVTDQVHVCVRLLLKLRRNYVCTQQGGDDRSRPTLRREANGAQGFQF